MENGSSVSQGNILRKIVEMGGLGNNKLELVNGICRKKTQICVEVGSKQDVRGVVIKRHERLSENEYMNIKQTSQNEKNATVERSPFLRAFRQNMKARTFRKYTTKMDRV